MLSTNSADLILTIQIVMGLSVFCFWDAYFIRKKSNMAHRALAIIGVLSNLFGAVYLVYHVHFEKISIVSAYPETLVIIHRVVAALVTVLMVLMAYTGITRKREIHIRLHMIFLISYSIIYISGLILFQAPVK